MTNLIRVLLPVVLMFSGANGFCQSCKDNIYFMQGAEIEYKTTVTTTTLKGMKQVPAGTTTYFVDRVTDSNNLVYSFLRIKVRASSCDAGYEKSMVITCDGSKGLDVDLLSVVGVDTGYACDVIPKLAHKYRYFSYQEIKKVTGKMVIPFALEPGATIPGEMKVKLRTVQKTPEMGRSYGTNGLNQMVAMDGFTGSLSEQRIDGTIETSDGRVVSTEKITTLVGELDAYKLSFKMKFDIGGGIMGPIITTVSNYYHPKFGLIKGGNSWGGVELSRYKLP